MIDTDPEYADPEWGSLARRASSKEESVLSILKGLPVFAALTESDLEQVERIVHRRWFSEGEVIIRARAPRTGMYVIKSGSADVVRPVGANVFHKIGHIKAGELVGEFAILDDSPRSTSIVAAEASELLGFFKPDLMDLVETNPRLGFRIVLRVTQMMAGRLREDIEQLRSLRGAAAPGLSP